MNYYIQRGTTQYGPYSLADLQRYVQSGEISRADLARSDAMTDWVPVSQVVGNIPVPTAQTTATATGVSGTGMFAPTAGVALMPPNMHWALVLLLHIVTCGIFGIVWFFIQSNYVKKIDPENKAQPLLIASVVLTWGLSFVFAILSSVINKNAQAFSSLFQIAGAVCYLIAAFRMKASLEARLRLSLSGVMVFFFSFLYFQYHFNEVNKAGLPGASTI